MALIVQAPNPTNAQAICAYSKSTENTSTIYRHGYKKLVSTVTASGKLMTNTVLLLLTGGNSTRFGSDKMQAKIGAKTVIELVVDSINSAGVGSKCYEVGRGYSNFPRIPDTELNDPLAAIGTAWTKLSTNIDAPSPSIHNALVIAGDSAWLDPNTIRYLFDFPGNFNVMPYDGNFQPLCARWSFRSLETAANTLSLKQKNKSVRSSITGPTIIIRDSAWLNDPSNSPFRDVDSQEDYLDLTQTLPAI